MTSDAVQVIKKSIRQSKMTHYAIAKQAGVSPSIVDRFMSGKRDINLATAGKLASVFELRLVPKTGVK